MFKVQLKIDQQNEYGEKNLLISMTSTNPFTEFFSGTQQTNIERMLRTFDAFRKKRGKKNNTTILCPSVIELECQCMEHVLFQSQSTAMENRFHFGLDSDSVCHANLRANHTLFRVQITFRTIFQSIPVERMKWQFLTNL